MHTIILATLAAVASAMPSYIAVPADQIAFLDLRELRARRVPRQTLTPPQQGAIYSQDYQPVPLAPYQQHTVGLSPPPQEAPAPARLVRVQAPDNTGAPTHGATSQYAERPQTLENMWTSGPTQGTMEPSVGMLTTPSITMKILPAIIKLKSKV